MLSCFVILTTSAVFSSCVLKPPSCMSLPRTSETTLPPAVPTTTILPAALVDDEDYSFDDVLAGQRPIGAIAGAPKEAMARLKAARRNIYGSPNGPNV